MLGKSSQCAPAGADPNNGGGGRKLGSVAITSSSPCRRFLAVIAARSSLLRLLQLSVAVPRWRRDGGTGPPSNRGEAQNLAALLTHCGQLLLSEISKFDAIGCQILRLKCTKFVFRWGSVDRTHRGRVSWNDRGQRYMEKARHGEWPTLGPRTAKNTAEQNPPPQHHETTLTTSR